MTSTAVRAKALLFAAALASAALGADADRPPGGTISYVLTDLHWAIYQSADGKTECPSGFNEGNREQFKQLFPNDGKKRSLADTQLRREIDAWYPTIAREPFSFHEAGGPTAYGLNLDGKAGTNDFASPDGEKGIDNQLYRVLGCIRNYRSPEGAIQGFDNGEVIQERYNRIIIRLTDVQSLVNDDSVNVTMYRGLDPVQLDATGKTAIPGGSQRIDTRWGSKYIQHMHGRIREGALQTEPSNLIYPWAVFYLPTDEFMYDARFKLKLSSTSAEGLIAGYSDIESWYSQMNRSYSTHHQSYGQSSAPSMYKAFRRLADGHPDPKTGTNTAISSALLAKFTSVLIVPSSLPQSTTAAQVPQGPPVAGPPFPRPSSEEVYPASRVATVAESRH